MGQLYSLNLTSLAVSKILFLNYPVNRGSNDIGSLTPHKYQ